jgi:capsular exopolysaccharide synthesis family protein
VLGRVEIANILPSILNETNYPEEWLAEKIKVSVDNLVMRLSIERPAENEAKLLLEAVTKTFMTEFVDSQTRERGRRLKEKEANYSNLWEELKRREDSITRTGKPIGGKDLKIVPERQNIEGAIVQQIEMNILKILLELDQARREKIKLNKTGSSVKVDQNEIDDFVEKDPSVIKQKLAIDDLEKKMPQLVKIYHPNDKAIKELQQQIEDERDSLNDLRRKLSKKAEEDFRKKTLNALHEHREKLDSRISTLEEDLRLLERQLKQHTSSAGAIDGEGLILLRELEERNEVLTSIKRLAGEIRKLKEEQRDPPRVELLETKMFRADDFSRRVKYSFLAALGGFGAIVFGIALLEFRSLRIDSLDDVVHGIGLNVMGTLPAGPSRTPMTLGRTNSALAAPRQTGLIDSIDSIRTMLMHAAQSGSMRIVMVTSAVGSEGKTSLATHLAASLARAGYKTLLVDADLRNPVVDRLFELSAVPGLSELLRGDAVLTDVIQATQAAELFVLTAGHCDFETQRALARNGLQSVFDCLRAQFECVVVDSSSILSVADSLSIAKNVDGVLFAIMQDVSLLPLVHAAYRRLEMLGIRVLGAVVNGATHPAPPCRPRTVNVNATE